MDSLIFLAKLCPSLPIIWKLLWLVRTVMEASDIILLLEFCLKNIYFSFQDQFYEKVEGAAMGSPVSPIVANLYMEYLEEKDIHKEVNKQGFLQHINSVDPPLLGHHCQTRG